MPVRSGVVLLTYMHPSPAQVTKYIYCRYAIVGAFYHHRSNSSSSNTDCKSKEVEEEVLTSRVLQSGVRRSLIKTLITVAGQSFNLKVFCGKLIRL